MFYKNDIEKELTETLSEWTSTSMGRRSFLKALPFLLASCATGPDEKNRYREGDNTGQAVSLTPQDEKRMADEVLPAMKKDYPPIKDPELQNYISDMGQRLVRADGLDKGPYNYTFQVVETEQVNAFALPAGPVFVTAPLIAMADSEAELAGVVGHEIGHIKSRHTAERIHKMERSKGKTIAYMLGGGVLGGLLGYGLGRLVCAPRDRGCMAKTTQLGAMAGAGGATIISKFGFMANSREDELEADRVGFRTSVKAGYSKDHVGDFYTKLLMMEGSASNKKNLLSSSFGDALSTHPPSAQRVQQMSELASQTVGLGRGKVSSPAFERIKFKAEQISKG